MPRAHYSSSYSAGEALGPHLQWSRRLRAMADGEGPLQMMQLSFVDSSHLAEGRGASARAALQLLHSELVHFVGEMQQSPLLLVLGRHANLVCLAWISCCSRPSA